MKIETLQNYNSIGLLVSKIYIFSLVSAFSQKNKTYNMGLCVCVCVCLCKILVPTYNFQTSYPIDTKFWLILQPFHHFIYVTAHSPTLPSLYLRHNSFTNPYVASPTSQLILQPVRRFTYVTTHSPTLTLFHLRHSSFSNSSFASPMLQALHSRHLESHPCEIGLFFNLCFRVR